MFTFIIILSALVQGLVALFVLQKNSKSLTNILFFLLSAFLITWAVINFTITRDPSSDSQLLLYRCLMASVVVQNTLFFLFSHAYPERTVHVRAGRLKLYLLFSAFSFAVALSPILFTKVDYGSAGARPVGGPGMLFFIMHAAVSIFYGLRALYRRYSKATGISRQQLRVIFLGSIILWGIVPLTNFVVSMATQTLFFARISPLYTLAFSSIIAYAIVAQKLFDIRAAVARSVGYILIIGTMSLLYGVALFGIVNVIFKGPQNETSRQIISVVLVTPLALSFQSIKEFFDRITNRTFFRNYYEPQDVLDTLTSLLVHSIDIDYLKRQSAKVLKDAIKVNNINYWLVSDQDDGSQHAQQLIKLYRHSKGENVLILDEYDADPTTAQHLRDNNVAAAVRLRTNKQDLGFLTLGFKESGEPYADRDKQLLSIAADEIAISLQNAIHFEEIQNFNQTLQERVYQATRELRRTNEKLKALDETKDDFISMASHQLRTPLTSVKGYLSMVLEGDAGKLTKLQREMLGQAFFSSQRMVYLISDLLNVSRLKTGKFIIEASPVNLADVVQQEMSQLNETAAAKSLTLHYTKPKDFPAIMLDETKTRQVVMNFMDNAIYYTPAGGQITIELDEKPAAVELRIRDNGIGVPKSEQHHLFTKFYRAGNARKARPDGTGLGLFMAKKVIAAQGGAVIFDSQEGKGSTFGFSFSKDKLAPTSLTTKA